MASLRTLSAFFGRQPAKPAITKRMLPSRNAGPKRGSTNPAKLSLEKRPAHLPPLRSTPTPSTGTQAGNTAGVLVPPSAVMSALAEANTKLEAAKKAIRLHERHEWSDETRAKADAADIKRLIDAARTASGQVRVFMGANRGAPATRSLAPKLAEFDSELQFTVTEAAGLQTKLAKKETNYVRQDGTYLSKAEASSLVAWIRGEFSANEHPDAIERTLTQKHKLTGGSAQQLMELGDDVLQRRQSTKPKFVPGSTVHLERDRRIGGTVKTFLPASAGGLDKVLLTDGKTYYATDLVAGPGLVRESHMGSKTNKGQFALSGGLERKCACGHRLGQHTAAIPKDCQVDDCQCGRFRAAKVSERTAEERDGYGKQAKEDARSVAGEQPVPISELPYLQRASAAGGKGLCAKCGKPVPRKPGSMGAFAMTAQGGFEIGPDCARKLKTKGYEVEMMATEASSRMANAADEGRERAAAERAAATRAAAEAPPAPAAARALATVQDLTEEGLQLETERRRLVEKLEGLQQSVEPSNFDVRKSEIKAMLKRLTSRAQAFRHAVRALPNAPALLESQSKHLHYEIETGIPRQVEAARRPELSSNPDMAKLQQDASNVQSEAKVIISQTKTFDSVLPSLKTEAAFNAKIESVRFELRRLASEAGRIEAAAREQSRSRGYGGPSAHTTQAANLANQMRYVASDVARASDSLNKYVFKGEPRVRVTAEFGEVEHTGDLKQIEDQLRRAGATIISSRVLEEFHTYDEDGNIDDTENYETGEIVYEVPASKLEAFKKLVQNIG